AEHNLRVPVERPIGESTGSIFTLRPRRSDVRVRRHCDARPPRAHAQVDSHTPVVTVHIRSLTAEDVDTLTAALAEAFHRDDLAVWIFPDQRVRGAALAAMFRSRLSEALHDDETVVDVADDLSGAAIWQSPRVRFDD